MDDSEISNRGNTDIESFRDAARAMKEQKLTADAEAIRAQAAKTDGLEATRRAARVTPWHDLSHDQRSVLQEAQPLPADPRHPVEFGAQQMANEQEHELMAAMEAKKAQAREDAIAAAGIDIAVRKAAMQQRDMAEEQARRQAEMPHGEPASVLGTEKPGILTILKSLFIRRKAA